MPPCPFNFVNDTWFYNGDQLCQGNVNQFIFVRTSFRGYILQFYEFAMKGFCICLCVTDETVCGFINSQCNQFLKNSEN